MMKLMLLEGSAQEKDIRTGKAPSDIFGGVGRVKTYVKLQDASYGLHPRRLEFDQPYQAAAAALRCSWNQTNPVYLVQAAGCNLDCPFCFIGDCSEVDTIELTPGQIIATYMDYRRTCHDAGEPYSRVFRISGGEPFLQDAAMIETTRAISEHTDCYVWLDTNLTLIPDAVDLLRLQDALNMGMGGSVCGCFKPHEGAGMIAAQAQRAQALIGVGIDCYFYWPVEVPRDAVEGNPWRVEEVKAQYTAICEWLAATVHPNAPLRTTFLLIKYHYSALAVDGMLDGLSTDLWNAQSSMFCRAARAAQEEFCEQHYGPDLFWLPSNQVPMH